MKDIIYFSSIPWTYFHHRQQEMVSWFSEQGFRVFFWEPNGATKRNLEIEILKKTLILVRNRGLRFERCLYSVNAVNAFLQRKAFGELCGAYGIKNPIIWFDRVHGIDISSYLNSFHCIYDLVDEITAFGRWKNERLLTGLESRVVASCNILVTSSRTLGVRKASKADRAALFIPNGIDASLLEIQIPLHDAARRKVAGFCGTLSSRRINVELIDAAARMTPQIDYVLVGPQDNSVSRLVFPSPNVTVLDPVSPTLVPQLMASFDVGIVPYRLTNGSMDYVFPKKVFEYMAAGLPVVSTRLPECLAEPGVTCVTTPEEFAAGVSSLCDASFTVREAQRQRARNFTWDVLLTELKSKIEALETKGSK